MKFKLVVMNLDGLIRPKESSWPMLLLEVFMPHSVDWLAKSRLDKIFEFQDFIMEIENAFNANESNDNECNECIENDIKDEESQVYELEDSNQQFDDMHNVDSSCYDDDCKEEERCDDSKGFSSSNEYECAKISVVEVLSEEEDVCDDQISSFQNVLLTSLLL